MSILRYLNRPSQKKAQDKQTEMSKRKQGPWLVRNIKWIMFVFFNSVALVFDGLAVTTVYTLTNGNELLSLLALLPTGIPMLMWEGGWLYSLASPEQKRRSIYGVVLSVLSALVVGILAILANLGDPTMRFWVSTGLLAWCVITVIIHGIWAAQYFYKDPVIMREHELQVVISDNEYQAESLDEAEKILDKAVVLLDKEQAMRKQYGEAEVNRALEILLGMDLNGDGTIGGNANTRSSAPALPSRVVTIPQNPPADSQQGQGESKWYTLEQFCEQIKLTPSEARTIAAGCKNHDEAFKKLVIDRNMSDNTDISGKNFRKLYYRDINPQVAAGVNGKNRP